MVTASPPLFWINRDVDVVRRIAMYSQLADGRTTYQQRVPAVDGYQVRGGDTARACLESHLRAWQGAEDAFPDSCALIAEDTLAAVEYQPYRIWSVASVIQHAPADWGILQLAFTHPAPYDVFATQVARVQHRGIFGSVRAAATHAPPPSYYLPWQPSYSGAVCYVVHPRARRHLLQQQINVPALALHMATARTEDVLFRQVPTYTFARPLFTYRSEDVGAAFDPELVRGLGLSVDGREVAKRSMTAMLQLTQPR